MFLKRITECIRERFRLNRKTVMYHKGKEWEGGRREEGMSGCSRGGPRGGRGDSLHAWNALTHQSTGGGGAM